MITVDQLENIAGKLTFVIKFSHHLKKMLLMHECLLMKFNTDENFQHES